MFDVFFNIGLGFREKLKNMDENFLLLWAAKIALNAWVYILWP